MLQSRKLQLIHELIRATNSKASTRDIQIGIIKDTWLAEFNEDLPNNLIEEMKKATE